MIFVEKSCVPIHQAPHHDPIYVFLQFFIPENEERYQEVKYSLLKNIENPYLEKIIMLNEREYTTEEMGVSSDKIVQVIIGHRLTYYEFFLEAESYKGYHVLINSDIELDETIDQIKTSDLHLHKKMYWLLRYQDGELFGNGRADSSDVWIFHSSHPLTDQEKKVFNFELGVPGCDNKIAYLCSILGYGIYNDPMLIHTHHHHASKERNYTSQIPPPYMCVVPYGCGHPPFDLRDHIIDQYTISTDVLYKYIVSQKSHFIIPRVSGVENIIAVTRNDQLSPVMKRNAGIHFTSRESIQKYSTLYFEAFEDCQLYASWEPWGHYIKHLGDTQEYIEKRFKKKTFSAYGFDIFHSIHSPWTYALRGKRILIISPFIDTFKGQSRKEIYGVDLFPDCTLEYIKPPQTQGTQKSKDWYEEYSMFCRKLNKIKDTFDVALCSCGGYANPVCHYLYSIGKSSIYVGGVLQMYFGVYGNRWIKERPEVLRLYMNTHWKRPSEEETPSGATDIENKCYW